MAMTRQLPDETLLPVAGVRIGVSAAGIRYSARNDLLVMAFAPQSQAAVTLTRNAFCAAPVTVTRQHLAAGPPRFAVINAGNANAGTGERGLADARDSCDCLAQLTGVQRGGAFGGAGVFQYSRSCRFSARGRSATD